MTTLWQDNAQRFATTVDERLAQERHAGVRRALELLVEGKPGRAHYELARSVERQVRVAGCGSLPIEPLCACGGRCPHGGVA